MKLKFYTMLGLLLSLVTSVQVMADNWLVNDFYYKPLTENTVANMGSYVASGDVKLPEKITYKKKTYTVTEIGEWAFSNNQKITSITLPATITKVNDAAFANAYALKKVVFGKGVKEIGRNLFQQDKVLETVIFNSEISELPTCTFVNCEQLESVTLPKNLKIIDQNAFYECYSLSKINMLSTVKVIRKDAFYNTENLKELNLASIDSIGDRAFNNSGIKTLTLGKNLKFVGKSAFSGSELKKLICFSTSPCLIDRYTCFLYTGLDTIYIPSGTKKKYQNQGWIFDHTIEMTTDVKGVNASSTEKVVTGIYDVAGHKQNDFQKGINIVKYSDGSTKKVVK